MIESQKYSHAELSCLRIVANLKVRLVTGHWSGELSDASARQDETIIYNISSDAQHQGTQSKKEVIVWCCDQLDNYHRYNVHHT